LWGKAFLPATASGNACPTSTAQRQRNKDWAIDLSFRVKSRNLWPYHAHSFPAFNRAAFWHIGNYFGMMRPAIALQDEVKRSTSSPIITRSPACAIDRFARKQQPRGPRFPRLRIEPR